MLVAKKLFLLLLVSSSFAASPITSWQNPTSSTTVYADIPNGVTVGQTCNFSDPNLAAGNIKSGVTIFNVLGTYTPPVASYKTTMASTAHRDPASTAFPRLATTTSSVQMTLENETTTYTAADLPTTGGYNYRSVPDSTKDDDGYLGSTCKYAPRPSVNCGTTQNTIAGRISDCATQNPSTSTWDGAVNCNGGEGMWKLITRSAANKEVWQDQRTGKIWSSVVGNVNYCRATGNTQMAPVYFRASYNNAAGTLMTGNGTVGAISGGSSSDWEAITITFTGATTFTVTSGSGAAGCQGGAITAGGLTTTAGSTVTFGRANFCSFTITQGSTNFANNDKFIIQSSTASIASCYPGAANGNQPASPVSYCAEAAGLNAPGSENWGTGVYMSAKGGMGKTATASSPSVRWRYPTVQDYIQAKVNGIQFVMPDLGADGSTRAGFDGSTGGASEWIGMIDTIGNAYTIDSRFNFQSSGSPGANQSARCVGR